MKITSLILAVSGLLLSSQVWASQTYTVDKSHSNLNFEVSHLIISTVRGRFDDYSGMIKLDKNDNIVEITGEALVSTINTNNAKRDKHLRSADFFDVENHPKLSFTAKNIKVKKGSKATVKGELSIRGRKKVVDVELNYKGKVTGPWGTPKMAVDATTTVNRKEFGLKWNQALESGGVMVGEDVKLIINIQANQKVAKK
ncbi:MAG: YceI family protein [Bdellovibrionales bacterium]